MRRVLILAPHYPPADTPDMHRVRMSVGHYRACGWEPVVLCVRAEDTRRLIDPSLLFTVPADIRVETVAAPGNPVFDLLGVNALGIRARRALECAGVAMLRNERFDLVFISTTSFPLMKLGAVWKRRFGTPFVLDFQDPWATFPESGRAFFRHGLRHGLMRSLHRRLEKQTVPEAAGLMAVSQTYVDLLQAAYPQIAGRPWLVSPFGYARSDFDAALAHGRIVPAVAEALAAEDVVCFFAGRVAPTMERALAHLFGVVAAGRAAGRSPFERLRFVFVGTGYTAGSSERLASRLAAAAGIAGRVTEAPERVSLLDAWRSTLAANVLLLLGSEDTGFTPSKMNALLSLEKPLICAAPAASPAWRGTADLETVVGVSPDIEADVAAMAAKLDALLEGKGDYRPRLARARAFETSEATARECALFDQVVAAAAP